jgi:hypothetical protein
MEKLLLVLAVALTGILHANSEAINPVEVEEEKYMPHHSFSCQRAANGISKVPVDCLDEEKFGP